MFANPAWTVDVTRVLTLRELATVLADAREQADRPLNAQRNLIIVRLACCCGLRVSEIGALRLDDVNVDGARPHIRLRRERTKCKKARCVPLWWDAGTLTDLADWQAERIRHGARGSDPFECAACSRTGADGRFSGRRFACGSCLRVKCSGWPGFGR